MRIAVSLFPYLKPDMLAALLDEDGFPYHYILAVVEDAYTTFISGLMCNDTRVMGDGFVIYPELDVFRSIDRVSSRFDIQYPRMKMFNIKDMCSQKDLLSHLQELPLSMGGEYTVTSAASVPTGVLIISDGR